MPLVPMAAAEALNEMARDMGVLGWTNGVVFISLRSIDLFRHF
jgi:hypothetical protein